MELESAELQFETSAEGQATGVQTKQELPMMRTVAELMIHANSTVAARIQAAFPRAALLRRHPPPRPEVFAEVCSSTVLHPGMTPISQQTHSM